MLQNICMNCGRDIKVMIFRGGPWCSDDCRKEIQGKVKCHYEEMWIGEAGYVDMCLVHGENSKYPSYRGAHRPCLAVEDWDD